MASSVPHRAAPDGSSRLIAPEHRDRLVELVAQRMYLDPENDSRPGLLVHLMLAAAEFGYRQWIRNLTSAGGHHFPCASRGGARRSSGGIPVAHAGRR